jgi:hypothetical protein
LLFLLAAIGASEMGACGGMSETRRQTSSDGSGGTDQDVAGSGAMPAAGASGGGGVAATSGRGGNGSDIPIMGSGAGGMAAVDRPPSEGVVGCTMPTPYPAPYPLPDPPLETGFLVCQTSGVIHRAAAQTCPAPFADPGPAPDGCPNENNCSDLAHGRCLPQNPIACRAAECLSECQSDSDCKTDELCLCDAEINHCVPASCHSDAECGPGLLCISTSTGLGRTPFACQTAEDECTATCPNYNSTGPNGAEQYLFGSCTLTVRSDGTRQRTCSYSSGTGGTCGRPFLVEGAALVARAVRRGDWLAAVAELRMESITPELRAALAAAWSEAALMEHASIAAFARFSLELLALGAPAELVGDAARAMSDEQQHAELCFALASAYAGAPLGPGPLEVRGCLSDVSLGAVLVTTFLEGCVGETLAAVEARERARHVLDPLLEDALLRIAEDEARHAALAWRFVQWALAQSDAADAGTLFTLLETERSRHVPAEALPPGVSEALARAHALVPAVERWRLRREVLDEIVAPCLHALCPRNASAELSADAPCAGHSPRAAAATLT